MLGNTTIDTVQLTQLLKHYRNLAEDRPHSQRYPKEIQGFSFNFRFRIFRFTIGTILFRQRRTAESMTQGSDRFTPTERLMSIKAALLSGALTVLAWGAIAIVNAVTGDWGLDTQGLALERLPTGLWDLGAWCQIALTALTGGLFGITYRYVVRSDRYGHLGEGAFLAFALTRSLGSIETIVGLHQTSTSTLALATLNELGQPIALYAVLVCVVIVFENLLLFAIARTGLMVALDRNWIAPFPSP